MDFSSLIKSRQSQRQYTEQSVAREDIMRCIEAAHVAPSACNAQPWKFIVVDQPELKNAVAEATVGLGMNKFCVQAPVMVVMVLEKPNFTSKVGSVLKNKEYSLMDIGIAATHFCLQATALGLSTCMIGWFDEKKIKKMLHVPKNKRLPLLITLGYPKGDFRPKVRKDLSAIYSYNTY